MVLGADNTDFRFKDAAALLNYGFANYKIVSPQVPECENLKALSGMKKDVPAKIEGTPEILVSVSEKSEIKSELIINENIEAPVNKGDILGKVIYKVGESEALSLPIKAEDSVEKADFISIILKMLELTFK